jgi:hypothetical protein
MDSTITLETCQLCGQPTQPFEQGHHQHCLADENIRADIESYINGDDLMIYSPSFQTEDGPRDSTAP